MRYVFLFTFFFIAVFFLFRFSPDVKPQKGLASNPNPSPMILLSDKRVWELVNEWRVLETYKSYKESELACSVANIRLKEVKKKFSHQGFLASRFCSGCTLGENLAKDFGTSRSYVQGWLASPSHRKNLEDPRFTHSCIKCENNYCVHIFSQY